ncbi:MAG: AmmeMemoRadiSam system radical SAM enzyme [Candidatus Lokiarchaeota archaeon]|nr:AmmeMemoRadiSam system radical SAM enzyme [Candidatus Lokiarchaeota archaeon]
MVNINYNNEFIKEAKLFEKKDDFLICKTCEHKCILKIGQIGFCKTRKNIEGKLYTLIYGKISSISNNPIEKKPFFHFHPGSHALTIGSFSCNFTCDWCQNYHISKANPSKSRGDFISPKNLVQLAKDHGSDGLSYSFNEPTLLLEHSLDVFKIAQKEKLYNTYVSNGYMTLDAAKLLVEHGLDAINIDIKGDEKVIKNYCHADINKIFRNASFFKNNGVHVELTTLVVTSLNDNIAIIEKLAKIIIDKLGVDTPWHLTRYHPDYKFKNPSTSIEFLERARKIGKNEGINYVYIGNVPDHEYENTYCPKCNELLLKRSVFSIIHKKLNDNKCPNCQKEILMVN